MSDKNIIKTIDEMPRFADSREKLEWAEAMYRKLCAEEGEMEPDSAEKADMSDKNIIKTIDEMPRFADSREKQEWAEAMYQKLCAEEGEMEPDSAENVHERSRYTYKV